MEAVNKIPFIGGFTEIIRSPNGFHILKLLGKRDDACSGCEEPAIECTPYFDAPIATHDGGTSQIDFDGIEAKDHQQNRHFRGTREN